MINMKSTQKVWACPKSKHRFEMKGGQQECSFNRRRTICECVHLFGYTHIPFFPHYLDLDLDPMTLIHKRPRYSEDVPTY